MPAPSLFDTAIDNRSLFSDYYLEERLPQQEEWRADVGEAFEAVKALYARERPGLEAANEAQTEERFIKPMLKLLGWEYDVQVEAKKHGRRNVPDYALFLDEADLRDAMPLREDAPAYFARAAAAGDAKYWGRPLDSATGDAAREKLSNVNPSFQIVNYMTAMRVDWGILTNGAHWRLYYAEARSRLDTYYEANLEHILREGDEDAFRRFYLFFRAAAFRPDAQTGRSFLEDAHDESVQYATAVEDSLKRLIFKEVFPYLAEGFLEYAADATREDPEVEMPSFEEIYHGTLRLLYRLLFLLYAEARELLPVQKRYGYYAHSLMHLKEDVLKNVEEGHVHAAVPAMWDRLKRLFRIIEKGNKTLHVPHYNGGLFNSANPVNSFLNDHAIYDTHLIPALSLLTRNPDGKGFIDYKALSVEQLGSIYEGLLEFRLVMGFTKPVLETDKGERKATGSYYTPHYIVEYIVEETLGPVIDERERVFRSVMEKLAPLYEKQARAKPSTPTAKGLPGKMEPLEQQAAEALLGLKVCDPAMGSGHFLVYAVDYLTERIIAILNDFADNPVQRRLTAIRARIVEELNAQNVSVDAERLTDLRLLKRMVMKRCIYGVDLNPMAVELARLSLWLDSFTVGAPLSFLNHHLKVGNSLIGERVREVEGQLKTDLFGSAFSGMLTGTQLMQDIAFSTDATFDEVSESARKYADYEAGIRPYKRLLDLWTSGHFGHEKARKLLMGFSGDAKNLVRDPEALEEKQRALVNGAFAAADEKHFFHWELEFPEVFFDLKRAAWKENAGFDAVVGNPPWVNIGRQSGNEADVLYFKETYSAAEYQIDLYTLFLERGVELLRDGAFLGEIVPDPWLANYRTPKIRELLLVNNQPVQILHTQRSAFPMVGAEHLIVLVQHQDGRGLVMVIGWQNLVKRGSLPGNDFCCVRF